jgi:predicted 3-demethylubiquinone-9 3-methyltransferase (glyoxalase superfamily)
MTQITPHLWYVDNAEEAAKFYCSIFPDSSVDRVTVMPSDSPSGPAGSGNVVEFTLFGQPFIAISAGPLDDFNHSISFMVPCKDQAEIDKYYDPLLKGGEAENCGWIKDKFGVSWQVAPAKMQDMIADKDRAKAKRAMDAMLKMKKIDLAKIDRAYNGETANA